MSRIHPQTPSLASFTKNRPRRIQPNLGPRKATPATKACYEPAASIAACFSMKQTNATTCRPAKVRAAWRSNSPRRTEQHYRWE